MPRLEKKPEDIVEQRRRSYARVFFLGNPTEYDFRTVLDDLAVFCRAFETTHSADRDVSKMLEGRREVFLRIMEFGCLDFNELFQRYHTRGRR